mmetsp:Transcript_44563/g.101567  ORF Transcript_44563/g.101567 Transcript_44563/m.101567 type:complete len:83 (-) Transcript_44563:216-464(-)
MRSFSSGRVALSVLKPPNGLAESCPSGDEEPSRDTSGAPLRERASEYDAAVCRRRPDRGGLGDRDCKREFCRSGDEERPGDP